MQGLGLPWATSDLQHLLPAIIRIRDLENSRVSVLTYLEASATTEGADIPAISFGSCSTASFDKPQTLNLKA